MKKIITSLLISLSVVIAVQSANTYLIYRSTTGGTWTNTGEITNPVLVDLSTVNGGSEASLNAWFADRSLETPIMGTGSQFIAGDQTWIISGTYVLTDTVRLFEGVNLYGGFAGTESAITGRAKGTNAWDYTNETILDGNATAVGIAGGSSSTAMIVDGLTIDNCKNSSTNYSGGGARISGALTTVQKCIIKNCVTTSTSVYSSGGIVLNGGATLKDSYIHGNQTSGYGGGVTVYSDDCTISGCKITNNTSTSFGAGVCLYANTSGVTVSNCDISNNTSTTKSGGGLLAFSTAVTNENPVTISNCTFTSNIATAGSGGAMYLNTKAGNTINVSNCTFTSNQANATKTTTNGGGAIWIGTGTHNIDQSTFTDNSVSVSSGGAILIGSAVAVATISKSVFTGNACATHGAALMLTFSATVNNCLIYGNKGANVAYVGTGAGVVATFNNSTLASNTNAAGTTPVGIYLSTPTAVNGVFTNCLFYNSSSNPVNSGGEPATVSYCGFESTVGQAYASANNCIKTIGAASFADAPSNDYHLVSGSTAVNAGTTIPACSTDLDEVIRPQGAAYDMGAYELDFTSLVSKLETSFDCYTDGRNIIIKGIESGKVINIYAVTGTRVFSKKLSAGLLSVALPQGIYIVNIDQYNKKVVVK